MQADVDLLATALSSGVDRYTIASVTMWWKIVGRLNVMLSIKIC